MYYRISAHYVYSLAVINLLFDPAITGSNTTIARLDSLSCGFNCSLSKDSVTGRKEAVWTSPLPDFYVSRVGSFLIQLSWNNESLAEFHPVYVQMTATANPFHRKRVEQAFFSDGTHDITGLDSDTFYNLVAEVIGAKGRTVAYNGTVKTLPFGKLAFVLMQ